jgi:hypothetical protein
MAQQPGRSLSERPGSLFPLPEVPSSPFDPSEPTSPCGSDEAVSEQADLDETPPTPRADDNQATVALKLETGGITQQRTFWRDHIIWSESIVAKLHEAHRPDLYEPLAACHTQESIAECCQCGRIRRFYNRCELNYCPLCQPRLARERSDTVQWWTQLIDQPKHVILTVRNSDRLTKQYVLWFKHCWSRLRRSNFTSAWRGGFYSLEITNEGQGWHLHLHALINARWIDAKELATRWAKIVGQDFAIVKVKDVRKQDYLRETTKYTVKGSQLASWKPLEIAAYIDAFNGVRTFGVFGKLYSQRTEWRKYLDQVQGVKPTCECGGTAIHILTPSEYAWKLETAQTTSKLMSHEAPQSEPSLFS